ncbi:hypothetical protein Q7I36_14775 [Aeromonas veronii]|uniref:hypothetical protein n=1 Tax=Aeromonas veronii TaxID=654 RepID=UPI0030058CD4
MQSFEILSDEEFDELSNGKSLTHHDSYGNINVVHQFVIPDGQVALLELFIGGVGWLSSARPFQ